MHLVYAIKPKNATILTHGESMLKLVAFKNFFRYNVFKLTSNFTIRRNKMDKLIVKGIEVAYKKINEDDYISLSSAVAN